MSHILAALCYVAHLVFIDKVYHLEPRERWVFLRSIGVAINLLGLSLTYWPALMESTFLRIGAALAGLVCSYIQGVSMNWYLGTPYIYSAIIPSFGAIAIRTSVLNSWIFMLLGFAVQVTAWLTRPDELANILSACSVAMLFVGALRSRTSLDIDAFISEQENLESQKKLIRAEIELNDQIKAFLPKEIFRRLTHLMQTQKLTPPAAMTQVLRCEKKTVTCLYTDIRGFTIKTKVVNGFVERAALPDIKSCTDIVEKFSGIPKLVGDLVFAFFDSSPSLDLLRSLLCSFELIENNILLNKSLPEPQKVQRFISISHGEAIVGNIGGTESSREINVLGNPANILSRIDPLTKDPKFNCLLQRESVILSSYAAEIVTRILPGVELKTIDLREIGLKIRDFDEENRLFIIPKNARNEELVQVTLFRTLRESNLAWTDPYSCSLPKVGEAA